MANDPNDNNDSKPPAPTQSEGTTQAPFRKGESEKVKRRSSMSPGKDFADYYIRGGLVVISIIFLSIAIFMKDRADSLRKERDSLRLDLENLRPQTELLASRYRQSVEDNYREVTNIAILHLQKEALVEIARTHGLENDPAFGLALQSYEPDNGEWVAKLRRDLGMESDDGDNSASAATIMANAVSSGEASGQEDANAEPEYIATEEERAALPSNKIREAYNSREARPRSVDSLYEDQLWSEVDQSEEYGRERLNSIMRIRGLLEGLSNIGVDEKKAVEREKEPVTQTESGPVEPDNRAQEVTAAADKVTPEAPAQTRPESKPVTQVQPEERNVKVSQVSGLKANRPQIMRVKVRTSMGIKVIEIPRRTFSDADRALVDSFIDGMNVTAVRGDRVVLNGQTFRIGDAVDENGNIHLVATSGTALRFVDASGKVHTLTF